jgi:hypothetical protein
MEKRVPKLVHVYGSYDKISPKWFASYLGNPVTSLMQ